ncbi:prolyl oligopeptidase family serine peptidase [Massilia sp. S19_KUP03_FR1]|uniref:prolyl oligopeptidase family serine peptidase n=1 Tax=Massilia sp. S19_KUP03_FR1 TaxID=3025503 RepID=UPI002FCDB3C6
MRIAFMAAISTLSLAVHGQAANTGLSNFPAIPKAEPLTEKVFGIDIQDPYRWMEKADRRADLEAWIKDSSLHTTSELAALPGRTQLLQSLQAASRANDAFRTTRIAGGKLFFQKLTSDRNMPVLMVREGGRERVLLDPMAGSDGKAPRAIGSYSPSPDGSRIAIQVAEGGSEIGKVIVLDVASGKPVGEELQPVWSEEPPTWLDNDTMFYGLMREPKPGVDTMRGVREMLHKIGTRARDDLPLLGSGVPTQGFAVPETSFPVLISHRRSPWVVAVSGNARAEYPMAVARLSDLQAGKLSYVQLADYDERVNTAEIMGNTLYYQTSKTDQNGEVRALALSTGKGPSGGLSLANSRLVMASGGKIITGIWATVDGLYVQTILPSAASQLYFLAGGKGAPKAIALPASQAIDDVSVDPDRKTLTFSMYGYTANSTWYRVEGGKARALGLQSATLPAAKARTVVEEWASSADGTRVPLTIVFSGARRGPAPTIIDAYGSYGVSGTPQYSTGWVVWNERGGVYAYCHIRGGGELGDAWHRAGMQEKKVNSHEDLIACGKRLVQLGYASPAKLGVFGASASGLLVPMAAMKAPELFAAAVTRVGIVNATRLAQANNGPNQFGEMGDPTTEAGFRALAAQDATLYLDRARGGPDFLFTIGLNDQRVDPWMSAKLVAMMRAKWGDQHLALIRSDGNAGHGIGSTRDQALEERADIYTFFLNRFGAPGYTR